MYWGYDTGKNRKTHCNNPKSVLRYKKYSLFRKWIISDMSNQNTNTSLYMVCLLSLLGKQDELLLANFKICLQTREKDFI
jgi:hypothetical protein